jgi:hypothetical protein
VRELGERGVREWGGAGRTRSTPQSKEGTGTSPEVPSEFKSSFGVFKNHSSRAKTTSVTWKQLNYFLQVERQGEGEMKRKIGANCEFGKKVDKNDKLFPKRKVEKG